MSSGYVWQLVNECKEECVTDISMSVHLSSVVDHFTYGLTNVREVL